MRRTRLLAALACLAAVFYGQSAAAEDTGERKGTPSPSGSAPMTTLAASTPEDFAAAMDVPADTLVSADLMGSDPAGATILTGAGGANFPTAGSSYVALSTGRAADALTPNSSTGLSTVLGGSDNVQGNDLVRLHLKLHSPASARCAAFDLAFLSEEYPEYVGSWYNDAFTAQLNDPTLGISGNEVIAPNNFARDTQGNPLSVNTVFGMSSQPGTTYDGTTSTLRASTPVQGDADVDVYLSIQDLGDSIYDSAVFLDNFFWSEDENCSYGSTEDTDGDGLLDDWETGGLDVKVDGVNHHVDLPSMGADKNVPDIFVETDYMVADDHSHKPDPDAVAEIVQSFADQGIHLHVDYGPDAPNTYGTTATWGDLSEAEALPHQDHLGDHGLFGWFDYSWDAFDDIKDAHFDKAREAVFHYNVWAHDLAEDDGSTSGISRGVEDGASDFIVSLGSWTGSTGSQDDQAGTFMHELGHNLGLHHGGSDDLNQKPNYLSVMNYAFQTGLPYGNSGNRFDYSRSKLFALNENDLDEPDGARMENGDSSVDFACAPSRIVSADPVDWNCDGDTEDINIAADINDDGDRDVLDGNLDWGWLTFRGGSIGLPGSLRDLPTMTFDVSELTVEKWREMHDVGGVDITGGVTVPKTPVAVGTQVDVSVPFTADHEPAVEWSWGDGTTSQGTSSGGPSSWTAEGSHVYKAAGFYTVTAKVGPSAQATSVPVVVYDPSAGFTTGGGTLTVPAGSSIADPGQTGKVRFGFVSQYNAGDAVPKGEMQVSWPEVGLNIHAKTFDWLVVQDDQATAAGATSVNGEDGYRFRLSVRDASDGDQLHLVVWDPRLGDADNVAAVVFDNQPSGSQTGSMIDTGQIKTHA